jgi:NAD(P)-dependent dehydrogenase (short-subunit alcohol dehydrogenase family)
MSYAANLSSLAITLNSSGQITANSIAPGAISTGSGSGTTWHHQIFLRCLEIVIQLIHLQVTSL